MRLRRRSTPVPPTKEETEKARADLNRFFADLPLHQRLWFVQVLLGMGLLIQSSVVELAVPVGRALAALRGVQTGPALGSLLTFLVFQAYTSVVGAKVASGGNSPEKDDVDGRLGRWLDRTISSGAEYLPAFGAVLPATVVLQKRSPLWGLALWPVVRLVAVMVLVADPSRLKKRHATDAQEDWFPSRSLLR